MLVSGKLRYWKLTRSLYLSFYLVNCSKILLAVGALVITVLYKLHFAVCFAYDVVGRHAADNGRLFAVIKHRHAHQNGNNDGY